MSERQSLLPTPLHVILKDKYDDPAVYENYVDKRGHRSNLAKSLVELIKREKPSIPGDTPLRALDIAAGTGIISQELQNAGYSVTAIDHDEKMLDFLRKKSPFIEAKQADMNQELPFEDNSYDVITSVFGNRYIKDTDAFLKEIHRVLKPGGVFVWPIFPNERPFWKMRNGIRQHTRSNFLVKDAQEAGFDEVEVVKMSLQEARG